MEKKLGLPSVISTGVGLIVATSCLMSLGQGSGVLGTGFIYSMILACAINVCTALCMAELNAVMPNLTGGLAQYTLAGMGPFITIITMVGGYLVCQGIAGSIECAMFGNALNSVFDTGIPTTGWTVILLVVLVTANLLGVDMFAKIQNIVSYGLIGSLMIMGIVGFLGAGKGELVDQAPNLASGFSDCFGLLGLAFFLFIGSEFVIPIAKNVRNERRNIPLGMVLSLVIICIMQIFVVLGMSRYCKWDELSSSTSPHILYGTAILGKAGSYWMILVSAFAVVSTVNSAISFFSYMMAGMAKLDFVPRFFTRQNKKGAYYPGILMIGGIMLMVNLTGLSSSDQLAFMILVAIVFWMTSYVIADINVLLMRIRFPKVPRTFKVPFGPVIPVIGILGNLFMIWNIADNPADKKLIFGIDGVIFLVLAVYSFLWCRFKLRKPLFRPYEIKDVMAMEHPYYLLEREKRS